MNAVQYIRETDIDSLLENYKRDSCLFFENGYNAYKRCYTNYFLQRKDYKRMIWNLVIKRIVKPPFKDAFHSELLPAFYPEGEQVPSFENAIIDMKENVSRYEGLEFEDEKSDRVLDTILRYRMSGNKMFLFQEIDRAENMYFDKFIKLSEEEVFVDCGAYNGDSIRTFLRRVNKYKKIIAFEPDSLNYNKLEKFCAGKNNIEIYNCILGESEGMAHIGGAGAGVHVVQEVKGGKKKVGCIDDIVTDKITFMKLDVEGSELDVLRGGKSHIVSDLPVLAVSAYHKLADIYKIQNFIGALSSKYRFYLRHYGNTISELVLYAVPDNWV